MKPFFITWKRLAESLSMAGIELTPCQNVYNPARPAWKCELTEEAAKLIASEYRKANRTVPAVVLDALQ